MSWFELQTMRKKSASEPKFATNDLPVDRSRSTVSSLPAKFLTLSTPPLILNNPPCCVAGGHFLSTSDPLQKGNDLRISTESLVNIDISDLNGDEEVLATTYSLRYCQETVLKPYTSLLLLIGWRPFHKEKETRCPALWSFINTVYPLLVIGLMTFYYVLQVVLCQGKLNIALDTKPWVTLTVPTVTLSPHNHTTIPTTSRMLDVHGLNSSSSWDSRDRPQCQHLLPNYILPYTLQFAAFLYGLRMFRIQDNEQLYSLMERVFVRSQTSQGAHTILVRNSRIQLVGAGIWILLHLGMEGLYNVAYESEMNTICKILEIDDAVAQGMILFLKFLGLFLVQVVNVAVILNYCTQCEMLIMYIRGICLWLREKTVNIKQAMHEILGVREFIGLLNSKMGKMTALCVITFTESFIIGLALLLLNEVDTSAVWVYRAAYPVIWLIGLAYPLTQAARVSKIGQKLRQITFEMRVFGYQAASQLELDSFIMFVNNATLRAKLFGVAIRPSFLIICLCGTLFVLLLLTTSGYLTINKSHRFF